MKQIVINTGAGFDLSHKAIMRYAELKGINLTTNNYNSAFNFYEKCENPEEFGLTAYFTDTSDSIIGFDSKRENYFSIYNIHRTDPALIQVVNELKESEQLDLKIVEVTDGVKWEIEVNEMGTECVREVSRFWS